MNKSVRTGRTMAFYMVKQAVSSMQTMIKLRRATVGRPDASQVSVLSTSRMAMAGKTNHTFQVSAVGCSWVNWHCGRPGCPCLGVLLVVVLKQLVGNPQPFGVRHHPYGIRKDTTKQHPQHEIIDMNNKNNNNMNNDINSSTSNKPTAFSTLSNSVLCVPVTR